MLALSSAILTIKLCLLPLGHVATDYAQAVPSTLRGLILLGTFLPKRFSLDLFPLPVLTLVGEVDGVVRITRLAQMLR